jgi:hypothetical protein
MNAFAVTDVEHTAEAASWETRMTRNEFYDLDEEIFDAMFTAMETARREADDNNFTQPGEEGSLAGYSLQAWACVHFDLWRAMRGQHTAVKQLTEIIFRMGAAYQQMLSEQTAQTRDRAIPIANTEISSSTG